ncbi:hypothetical protein GQ54DRAFT_296360 [Martensiomyces pterosporus]|nr:hypothetical protein GQ54DRAFT_296360 [Martensiomyces pterosporus]
MSAAASSNGLSIKRIATYQQYKVPLAILSETAQQTALPLQEALVRESLSRGLYVIVVCTESAVSADIAQSPHVKVIDKRVSLQQITTAGLPPANISSQINFAQLEGEVREHIVRVTTGSGAGGSGYDGILVVFDSLDRLLRESTVSTLVLLRGIRRSMGSVSKSRILARYPRDTFARHTEGGKEAESSPMLASTLCNLADAVIDVYPLESLDSWMPGWYSDGRPRPFVSLGHNDTRRALIRLEHRKQSGKVGLEVSAFEIQDSGMPLFTPISVAASSVAAQDDAGDLSATQPPALALAPATSSAGAKASGKDLPSSGSSSTEKQAPDPTANLPFNLSLTEKQRRDKASVELPYLEAQLADLGLSASEGSGVSTAILNSSTSSTSNGGEIYYQLDEEDDWDEDDPDDDLEI